MEITLKNGTKLEISKKSYDAFVKAAEDKSVPVPDNIMIECSSAIGDEQWVYYWKVVLMDD